ncbi:MAG: carboxypeptidase regulatory-like domain-containing protein [Gammaproteobacteria bacterium]|nr:carboxypeptidase regulatory-like domain-containing protein [Gammaproteobacteria bacterium]
MLFSLSALADAAEDINQWTPSDDDLRILEMRVEQYRLEDLLATYQRKDMLLIPMGLLAEILDLAVDVNPGAGTAEGFMFREDNTIFLDTTRNEITVRGKTQAYNSNLVYVLDDDIYIDANLISKWFDIRINADLFSATIKITSDNPFPFIVKMQREERITKTRARLDQEQPYYPHHYEPYDLWNVPFFDQTLETTRRQGDGDSSNTFRSTTFATADLLHMSSSLYLFLADDDELNDVRFTLGKKDPESELLGFARATEYALGSIMEPRLKNLTIPGDQQAGALLSNFTLGRQDEYSRQRFRGNLLPGWEVELYQNDRLIGYQSEAVDGQYDFQDIPLLFGRNYFRLVFYGPQGQVREQEEFFEVGQSLTRKGEHFYRVLASDNERGGNRVTAQYDVGLNDRVSASFIGASIPLDVDTTTVEQHNYLQAGLRGFWESFFVTFDVIDDIDGGEALDFELQTGFNNTSISLNHTILNHFFSEEFKLTQQEFKDRTKFRIDTSIPPSIIPRIPFSLELIMSDFESGNDRNELNNLISLQTYGLSLSNLLSYVQNSDIQNVFTGTFGVSSNFKGYGLRGTINYEFKPESDVTTVDLTLRPPLYNNYQFTYGLNHSLRADLTQASASVSKSVGSFNLSAGLRYNTDSILSLDARFSVGLGREPRENTWVPHALAIAGRGSVSARVFLDNNEDGLFNEGDEPIENVGFTVNNGYQQVRTDASGIAFMTGLLEYRPVNLAIAISTLEDPLWSPALPGMRIIPRPGQAMQLDFPVFTSGEIDGTVYLTRNGKTVPAGQVQLEVVDENGRVVKTSITEYDGFYVISKIPLGKYRIRVSRQQIEKLNLSASTEPEFEITADNQFESGIDFTLIKIAQ